MIDSTFQKIQQYISKTVSKPFLKSTLIPFLLIGILAVAFFCRWAFAHFGLPYMYYWDEPQTVFNSIEMMKTGDFNPHFFNYGSLLIYISLVVDIIVYFYLMTIEHGHEILRSVDDLIVHGDFINGYVSHTTFLFANRLLIAVFGTATVLLVYKTAKKIAGVTAGLVSAVFLAGLAYHIEHSARVTTDVPAMFFLFLSAYFTIRFMETHQQKWLLFSAVFLGFSVSIKYNTVYGWIIPIGVALVYHLRGIKKISTGTWIGIFLLPIVAGLVGTPYGLLDLPAFLNASGFEITHYGLHGHGIYTIESGWPHFRFELAVLIENIGLLGIIFGTIGLFVLGRSKYGIPLLVLGGLSIAILTQTIVPFPRNFMILYPILAVAFGCGVSYIVQKIIQKAPTDHPYLTYGLYGLVALGSILSLRLAIDDSLVVKNHVDSHTVSIEKLNELATTMDNETSNRLRVGIPLHEYHPIDLAKISAEIVYIVKPLNELLCTPEEYDLLMVTQTHTARQPTDYYAKLDEEGRTYQKVDGYQPTAEELIDNPGVSTYSNPPVYIVTVDKENPLTNGSCTEEIASLKQVETRSKVDPTTVEDCPASPLLIGREAEDGWFEITESTTLTTAPCKLSQGTYNWQVASDSIGQFMNATVETWDADEYTPLVDRALAIIVENEQKISFALQEDAIVRLQIVWDTDQQAEENGSFRLQETTTITPPSACKWNDKGLIQFDALEKGAIRWNSPRRYTILYRNRVSTSVCRFEAGSYQWAYRSTLYDGYSLFGEIKQIDADGNITTIHEKSSSFRGQKDAFFFFSLSEPTDLFMSVTWANDTNGLGEVLNGLYLFHTTILQDSTIYDEYSITDSLKKVVKTFFQFRWI